MTPKVLLCFLEKSFFHEEPQPGRIPGASIISTLRVKTLQRVLWVSLIGFPTYCGFLAETGSCLLVKHTGNEVLSGPAFKSSFRGQSRRYNKRYLKDLSAKEWICSHQMSLLSLFFLVVLHVLQGAQLIHTYHQQFFGNAKHKAWVSQGHKEERRFSHRAIPVSFFYGTR